MKKIMVGKVEIEIYPLDANGEAQMATIRQVAWQHGVNDALLLAYHSGRVQGRVEGARSVGEALKVPERTT